MLTALLILSSAIFVVGYAAIALEHPLKVSKSAIALIMGSVLWALVAFTHSGEELSKELATAGSDIFALVAFLLAAMCLVEVLIHYRFFDVVRGKLLLLKLDDRKQFLLLCLITFLLSSVVDNMTCTIIMIQISRKFFKGENLLVTSAAIVISSNAGGAFSPIGDVTTLMIWFAQKFGAVEIIAKGFLPSVVLWVITMALMYRKITPNGVHEHEEIVTKLSRSERIIVWAVFITFALPLVVNLIGLPPYFGRLFGLGIIWLLIDIFKRYDAKPTHLSASIEDFFKKSDISSLKFFMGILLAVAALHSIGVLTILAQWIYGDTPGLGTLIGGNIIFGLASSILDNVPLTAIAINMLKVTSSDIWILLAITVGTGGSLLVVGSASGVVAMGMNKGLTFGKYFKIVFFPALAGYAAAIAVWYLQFLFF